MSSALEGCGCVSRVLGFAPASGEGGCWVWAPWALARRHMRPALEAGDGHTEGEASAPGSLLTRGLCPAPSLSAVCMHPAQGQLGRGADGVCDLAPRGCTGQEAEGRHPGWRGEGGGSQAETRPRVWLRSGAGGRAAGVRTGVQPHTCPWRASGPRLDSGLQLNSASNCEGGGSGNVHKGPERPPLWGQVGREGASEKPGFLSLEPAVVTVEASREAVGGLSYSVSASWQHQRLGLGPGSPPRLSGQTPGHCGHRSGQPSGHTPARRGPCHGLPS